MLHVGTKQLKTGFMFTIYGMWFGDVGGKIETIQQQAENLAEADVLDFDR